MLSAILQAFFSKMHCLCSYKCRVGGVIVVLYYFPPLLIRREIIMSGQKFPHTSNAIKHRPIFSFLLFFSLLFFLGVLVVAPILAYDYDGVGFGVDYAPENLGVGGGVNDTYNVITITAKTDDVKTLRITFDLPDGVSYVQGTVDILDSTSSDYTISEYDVSNLNQPVFEILNSNNDNTWNADDYVKLHFLRTANCEARTYSLSGGIFKDYASLTYDKDGTTTTDTDSDDNTGTYSLLYASLSLADIDSVTGNVGDTLSRPITVTNGGFAGTSVITHEVWPGAGVDNYKLYYNTTNGPVELTPDASVTDHLVYHIDMTTSPFADGNGSYEDGDENLEDNESLIFMEEFKMTQCNADAIYHQASWSCQATDRKGGSVLTSNNNPELQIEVLEESNNICGKNHFKIKVTNTGTDTARDVLINLGMGHNGDLLDISYDDNNRWAFDCAEVNSVSGFMINGHPVTMDEWDADYSNCGSDFTYAILPNTHDNNSDIANSGGLADLDGDNYYDDLAAGGSLTFEFDYEMNPRKNCGVGEYEYLAWEHLFFNTLNKDQCGNTEVEGVDLAYNNMIRDYYRSTMLEADTDAGNNEEFTVSIAPSVYSNVDVNDHDMFDDSDDSELTITLTVPTGISLAPGATGFTQNGNEIIWSTTDLENRYLLGQSFAERFKDFPLVLDCTSYTQANGDDPIVIDYKTHLAFAGSNGNICLERDIHCGQFPPIEPHCNNTCAGPSITKFDSHRITPGWTDDTMTQLVDLSQADSEGYELDYYLAGDEMQIDVEGEMGNAAGGADNLHFVFNYTTDGNTLGVNDLKWITGTLYYYDASTNSYTTPVDLTDPTVSSSGDTHTVEFDLPLDSLGGQVIQGDKFYLELHYQINKYLPDYDLHHLVDFRGHFYSEINGQEISCSDWGDNVYYTRVIVEPVTVIELNKDNFQDCEERWIVIRHEVNSNSGDIHPNEFRPPYRWNYTRVQLPDYLEVLEAIYVNLGSNYVWTSGEITVTNEGNSTYLLEPVPAEVPLKDHSVSQTRYVELKVKGSCTNSQDNTINVIEESLSEFVYLPNGVEEKTGTKQTSVDYQPPTYDMLAPAPTITIDKPYADIDIQVKNTSPNSVDYHWIYMPGVSGVDIESVQNITDPNNPQDLTFHEDANGSVWVEIGSLDANEIKNIRFHALYTSCENTPINFYLGFDCLDYPADFTEAATAMTCSGVSTTVTLQPGQAEVQLKINSQPDSTVDNCSPFTIIYEINSAQYGTIVSPTLEVDIPGGVDALTFDSVTVEYPKDSGYIENISLPLTRIDANTVLVPITHTKMIPYGGLPGFGAVGNTNENDRKALVSLQVQTTCDFPSNSALSTTIRGNRMCGNPATGDGTTVNSKNIVITNLEPKYTTTLDITADEEFVACINYTNSITVTTTFHDIPGDSETGQTGDSDYSKVTLPPGVTYVDGSFQNLDTTHTITLTESADDYLLIQFPPGLVDNDTVQYQFDIQAASDAECALDQEVFVENYVQATSTCGTQTCSNARIRTGASTKQLDLIKPKLTCNNSGQATMKLMASGNEYAVEMSVTNTSTNPAATFPDTNQYKIYCADSNGLPTGSSLYTGTTPAIAVGSTTVISETFTSDIACSATDGLILVWDKTDNCLCDTMSCPAPLTVTNLMVAIGNRVWADTNNDSKMNEDESGIDGITVQLFKDANGNGICEPGGADGATAIMTTTTTGGGYYQFLALEPSNTGDTVDDKKTYYCVVIPKDSIPSTYQASSHGWTTNPDVSDENPDDPGTLSPTTDDAQQGDDGYPSGNYVIANPLQATLNGQQGTDRMDADGYPDDSSYFTVDFGFVQDESNAISLKSVESTSPGTIWWGLSFLTLGLLALARIIWRRRQTT